MPGYHHDSAQKVLAELARAKDAASFRALLNEELPAWSGSATPMRGYSDPDQHASIVVSRCLHDCLPVPFNALKFDWEREHGFASVMSYIDAEGRTEKEIAALVDKAITQCEKVAND